MKNLKKLFAVVATFAVVASTLPTSALAASYSDELQGAYDYAYGIGITTQSSIDSANMYGNLQRSHMAKMLVNYAKEVLGKTADTSVEVNFTDIADQNAELQSYIKEAAQMGIMGLNSDGTVAEKFNPTGVVTRAQFGTALDRILNGSDNDGSTPYYKAHLEALKAAGIMNNISTPDSVEVRGYVMLMLQRADEGTDSEDATCSSAEVILACTLGTSACPAECKDTATEEANGNLTVKMVSSNGGDVPYGVPALEVATYKITADEDVRLDSLTLKRAGYVEDTSVPSAALYINGGRVSKIANFNSDDEATVAITNGYTLKAGASVEISAYVNVADVAGAAGDQFSIELSKVSSTAEDVDMASDLTSDTFKILSKQNKTIAYAVQTAVEDPKLGEEAAELFEFKLTNASANDQDATLKAITFKEATANEVDTADLENFQLVVDGDVIAEADGFNGKYLTFNVKDGYSIKKGKAPIFTVKADVNGGAGEDISFLFDNAMDLTVIGDTYDIPMNVTGAGTSSNAVTVSAGKVTITKVNTSAGDLLRNKDNVFMGAFTITNAAGESLYLDTLDFAFGTDDTVLENVEVRLGSTTASPIDLDSNWAETDLDKSIGSKLTVYVYADTKDVAMTSKSLRMVLSNIVVKESADDNVAEVTPTSLTWSNMAGTDAALTLTNVSLGALTVSEGTEGVDAVSFKIKASDAVGTLVKKMTFIAIGVDTDTITAATLVNGTDEYTTTVKNGSIVVDEDFSIAAGKTAALVLKVDTASNPELTGVKYILAGTDIEAVEDTDDQDDITIGGTISGRTITITDAGTMQSSYDTVATNNKYAKNILGGEEKVVAEYSVYSKYEGINVGKATVSFDEDLQDSVLDVQLFYGDTMVASDPTWTDAATAVFDDLDFDTATAKKALTVKILSKVIGENNGDVSVSNNTITSVELQELKGADSGEDVLDYTLLAPISNDFSIVPVNVVTAVKSVGTTKGDIEFTTSNGTNETTDGDEAKATLETLYFTVDGNNGALQSIILKNDLGSVIGSVAVNGNDGDYDIAVGEELSNGTTKYTVSAVVSGSINTPSYNISLSDVEYSTNVDSNNAMFYSDFGAAKDVIVK